MPLFFISSMSCFEVFVFEELIQENDLEGIQKLMRDEHGKNLREVQRGIEKAIEDANCEALKLMLTSPLSNIADGKQFIHYATNGGILKEPCFETANIDVLNILLTDNRFDVNESVQLNVSGQEHDVTPLMFATQFAKENPKYRAVVKSLLNHSEVDLNFISGPKFYTGVLDRLHDLDIADKILNHKNMKQSFIQHLLLRKLSDVISLPKELNDVDDFQFELIKKLINKNFENGFCLKNILDLEFQEQTWTNTRIAEEIEMTIREEYYKGNVYVSEKSIGNQAFGISMDAWQALILKCRCVGCLFIKNLYSKYKLEWKSKPKDEHGLLKYMEIYLEYCEIIKERINSDKKKNAQKCDIEGKLTEVSQKKEYTHTFTTLLIASPMAEVFQLILLHHANADFKDALDGLIDGTMAVADLAEIGEEFKEKITLRLETKKQSNDSKRKENIDDDTEKPQVEEDYSKLCWACSVTDVKLYKCGGCRKARYCSDKCIRDDREEHMDYCNKLQEKRKKEGKKEEIVLHL